MNYGLCLPLPNEYSRRVESFRTAVLNEVEMFIPAAEILVDRLLMIRQDEPEGRWTEDHQFPFGFLHYSGYSLGVQLLSGSIAD